VAPYTKKDYPASVSTFALDKYGVTVGRFRSLVAAKMGTMAHPPAEGAGTHPAIPGSGWNCSAPGCLTVSTLVVACAPFSF
jgi:formylglycine-generating enzyme required for sulfatase activity